MCLLLSVTVHVHMCTYTCILYVAHVDVEKQNIPLVLCKKCTPVLIIILFKK